MYEDDVVAAPLAITRFNDSDVLEGESYSNSVEAFDFCESANIGEASSPDIAISKVTKPPLALKSLVAFNTIPDSIALSWKKSVGYSGGTLSEYAIHRDSYRIDTALEGNFKGISLRADRVYSYQATAIESSIPPNEHGLSVVLSVSTFSLSDSATPGVSQDHVSSIISTSATLYSWLASTEKAFVIGLSRYQFYRKYLAADYLVTENSWFEQTLGDSQPSKHSVSAVERDRNESELSHSVVVWLFTLMDSDSAPQNIFDGPKPIYSQAATSVALEDIDQDNDMDNTIVDRGTFHYEGSILDWFEPFIFGGKTIGKAIGSNTGDSELVEIDTSGDLNFVVSADAHSGGKSVLRFV